MHYSEKNLPFGGVGESGMGAYHGKEGKIDMGISLRRSCEQLRGIRHCNVNIARQEDNDKLNLIIVN